MLITVTLAGSMSVDAKTTKKKSKARTSQQSVSSSQVSGAAYMVYAHDFFKFSKGKIAEFRNLFQLMSYLENKGYKLVSTDKHFDYQTERSYENNGIKVILNIMDNNFQGFVEIQFATNEQTRLFLSNLKSSGWRQWASTKMYYYKKGYTTEASYEIRCEGNNIMIEYFDCRHTLFQFQK